MYWKNSKATFFSNTRRPYIIYRGFMTIYKKTLTSSNCNTIALSLVTLNSDCPFFMYANDAVIFNDPGVIFSAIWESAYNVITVS